MTWCVGCESLTLVRHSSRRIPVFRSTTFAKKTTTMTTMMMESSSTEAAGNNGGDKRDFAGSIPNNNIRNTNSVDNDNRNKKKPVQKKFHHLTVCMVPPDDCEKVWQYVTRARTELRDPGLFRWPPHANLLYPFLNIQPENGSDTNSTDNAAAVDAAILQGLENACRACEPFRVRIDRYGTFGGKHRGVLWLYPASYRELPIVGSNDCNNQDDKGNDSVPTSATATDQVVEPLIALQGLLEQQFPDCSDQRKGGGVYNPHMTVSHFIDLPAALVGKAAMEAWWPGSNNDNDDDTAFEFPVGEIYLLQRTGDNGQFERLVTVGLGASGETTVHQPAVKFVHMPNEEADWVRDERMQLKSRRNGANKRRNGQGGRGAVSSKKNRQGRGRSSPRVVDSPEVIEAKRAARKAKREALDDAAANASDSHTSDSSLSE